MKKAVFILIMAFATSLSFGQELQVMGSRTYDQKLVGCWKGSEIEQQQKGVSKYWVSCRFGDGTSTLLFIIIYKNGKVTPNYRKRQMVGRKR